MKTVIASTVALIVTLGAVVAYASPSLPPGGVAADNAVVVRYDSVRTALAADDLAAARKASHALAAAARAGGAGPHRAAIATRADELRAAGDIAAARLAFGELSRALITLLVAEPALAVGATAYRCPMAKGYKKWVQLGGELANPYMGKRMLKCGSKTALAV